MRPAFAPALFLCATALPAQVGEGAPPFRPQLAQASTAGRDVMVNFELAPGLEVELVAAEPGLANPVAFTIDHRGRLFVVETFRLHMGVTDMRNHRGWLDDDLACTTVAQRVANQTKYQAENLAQFATRHERVRILTDTNRDRIFDTSKVFADGWNRLEDGIAAGVLVDGDDVWVTNIPSLWRLRDTDGDGVADVRDNLQNGYGVHVSLLGHDLHGLRIGPDRRLYFSIGDRGFNVHHEGVHFEYPHEGAVLRCELDGSKLEVIHRGLRNPQELAFDALGNLFTGDNNSDGGDRARWVYVVEGGHSGWCIGYQWLDDRGAWNQERLWWPRFDGQAAWIVPPIANIASGPSGLTYYPGTGLPERYDNNFFLCDFRGAPGFSGVYNLEFATHGASFELLRKENFIWKVLSTDVEFGVEGGLYLADWVTGWGQTGKGRVYRIHDPALERNMALVETKSLLYQGMKNRSMVQLEQLLHHRDQRVRQEAQFALVDRGAAGLGVLAAVAKALDDRVARLHGIWGVGIAGRADPAQMHRVAGLLNDGDAEVVAQTAKVLGDARYRKANGKLRGLLTHPNSRVRFFAAQALGKVGDGEAFEGLVQLLRDNADRDAYLRHGAVAALARLGAGEQLRGALTAASPAVRLGAVLVLRRLVDPAVALALADQEPRIAVAAARAIYDFDGIPEALPRLAELIEDERLYGPRGVLAGHTLLGEALHRRVLNAQRRLRTPHSAIALGSYAERRDVPEELRIEALEILADWPNPKGQDRVFGNWRPVPEREDPNIGSRLAAGLADMITAMENPLEVRVAACRTAVATGAARMLEEALAGVVRDGETAATVRVAALRAIDSFDPYDDSTLPALLRGIDADSPMALCKAAVTILGRRDPAAAVRVVASILVQAPLSERQNAMQTLGAMKTPEARALIVEWLERTEATDPLRLDVLEAAAANSGDPGIEAALEKVEAGQRATGDSLTAWLECLQGGDPQAGQRIFEQHQGATCTRCHTLNGKGGEAGPVLDGVGGRRDRRYLLESLVTPTARITEGFGSFVFHTKRGGLHMGIVVEETPAQLVIMDPDGKKTTLALRDITRRSDPTSSMPAIAGVLSKRQIRDVVAFLVGLRDGK